MVHMLSSFRKVAVVCTLALLTFTNALPQQSAPCRSTHALVGTTITWSPATAFPVTGTITIVDDCSADVNDFSVRGLSTGFQLRGQYGTREVLLFRSDLLTTSASGVSQTFILRPGMTWDSVDFLFVRFVPESVDVAGLFLIPTPKPSPTLPAVIAPPTPPAVVPPVVPVSRTTELMMMPSTTAPAPIVATPAPSSSVERVLANAPTILVTNGRTTNYPNPLNPPPTLNISFFLNYVETPTLTLTRGVTYTFIVTAGNAHPFYFTTSEIGAKGINQNTTTEIVFAGSSKSFGNASAPFQLSFTPGPEHPDLFYYQCWFHGKMGWQVKLVNGPTSGNGTVDPISNVGTPPQVVAGSGATALTASGALAIILVVLASVLLF